MTLPNDNLSIRVREAGIPCNSLEKLRQGISQNVYRMEYQNRCHILKVYTNTPQMQERLKEMRQLLEHLHSLGFPVSHMVDEPRGYEKEIFVRYQYLQGKTVSHPTSRQLAQAAQWLGKLHAKGQILHGDYFPDNVLFEGDRLVGICDFDLMEIGSFYQDLASAAIGWCFAGHELDRNRLHFFLQNYQQTSFSKKVSYGMILKQIPIFLKRYIRIRHQYSADDSDLKAKLNWVTFQYRPLS